ncbi:MAG: uroporphyrinogen decarboxylase family protein, partial [Kiritimatiellae bacterium]|nr:uroporphyrinogen decarboxylase family protein [Kiritimatiellia bacterium]
KLCDYFKSKGLPVMYHTDGKLDEVLPLALEAGVTAIQPIEAKAGNDVCRLKELYAGRLVLVGNIDVQKMSGSRADIEGEIRRKLPPAKKNGGYIYHSDHSVPPSVSFENYKFARKLLAQYGLYE